MNRTAAHRWRPIALAVAMHAALAGLFALGYWQYHRPKPPQPLALAIEATVVDARRYAPGPPPSQIDPPTEDVTPPASVEPPAPELKPEPVPKPERKKPSKAEEREKRKAAQEKAAQERLAQDKAAEKKKAEKAEKAEKSKQEAERKAREETERKAREEVEKQAREKAAADRQLAQRAAELRARLAAEEHYTSAQAAGLLAQYQAQIQARIERAWIRPASAKSGLNCEVRITQVAGGEVVGVQVGRCNGDESVRQSIEAAAYRASPLPLPSDPALFDRNLVVTFRPQD